MSSLTDLNNAANETLQFDDDRDPNVIFNIYLEQTQFEFTSIGTEFSVLFPLDILEIDNVAAANVRFRISVPSDYTVDFSSLAPNLSLSQTGTDYTISGITGLSDWLTLKSVTVGIPSDLEGQAAYTASILWNTLEGPQNYTWNVGVFRPVGLLAAEFDLDSTPGRTRTSGSFPFIVSDLEATLEPFYLDIPVQDIPYGMLTPIGRFTILGINPTISAPFDPVWTLNIEASNSNAIEQIRLLPQNQDPGFSFNSSTKVATIVGDTSTVNTILSNLIVDAAQFEQPFDLIYTLDNDVRPGIGSTRQRFIPISQSFIQPRRFNNTIVDGTAFTADTDLFEETEVVFQGLDPELNYSLTLSVPSGQGNLRWATNISPLVYSSRTQSITISGTISFIQARLQGNRIQHRSSNNIFDDLEITVTLNQGPFTLINSALIKVTPRFTVTGVDMNSNSNLISTLNIRHGGIAELNSQFTQTANAIFTVRPIIELDSNASVSISGGFKGDLSSDLTASSSLTVTARAQQAAEIQYEIFNENTLIRMPIQGSDLTYYIEELDEHIEPNIQTIDFNFVNPGIYNIRITADELPIRSFRAGNLSPSVIQSIANSRVCFKKWKTAGNLATSWNLNQAFARCNNIDELPQQIKVSGQQTSMISTFSSWNSPVSQDLSGWDISEVTVLSSTFNGVQQFNCDVNNWDTSSVLSLLNTFANGNFNQPIGNWNVSSVEGLNSTFEFNTQFDQPIGSWNTSNVVLMEKTFKGSRFNQDIGSWNVSNVIRMNEMFRDNVLFDNGGSNSINNWDVSNVTEMTFMFGSQLGGGAGQMRFNQYIGDWDVSNVTAMSAMFRNCFLFNQDLSTWTTGLTAQPNDFSTGANATFADNTNNLKPFLADGVTRINT